MELRAKCNNQIEIQQNFKWHSDMGKRGRGARRRRSGTQESASSESGTTERASVSPQSNQLVSGPPTAPRAAEEVLITEKSLRLVSRVFEKQEEHAVVVGTRCGVEITRKMFGLDGLGRGRGPRWELIWKRAICWDLYLLTDILHVKKKRSYWKPEIGSQILDFSCHQVGCFVYIPPLVPFHRVVDGGPLVLFHRVVVAVVASAATAVAAVVVGGGLLLPSLPRPL